MTSREFYKLVIEATMDSDAEDYQAMYQFATEAVEKLDHKNELRKSKDSKAKIESTSRREAVLCALTNEAATRDTIAEVCNITTGQATAALSALVRDGKAQKSSIKVGKTLKTVYTLA